MEANKILFEIKSLNKMIVRKMLLDGNVSNSFFKNPPTPTQMQIIEYVLKNRGKDVYQKDLENVLNLRRATVSGVLQTMEKNNLITRVTDEYDTRVKKIIISKDAQKIFHKHAKKMEEICKMIVKDISDEELNQFMETVSKMKNNLKNNL
jgi:DNA-binding MarR family transcriptional regulator